MENIIDGADKTSQAPSGESQQDENLNINLDNLDGFLDGQQEPSIQPASSDNKPEELEIDPRFKDLPVHEGLVRTLQSSRDSLRSQYEKAMIELEQERKLSSLVREMLDDENLLYTFVNEVKPGLIPEKDSTAIVKERLKAKFGDENFRPTLTRADAERDDPGGKDWQYYRLLDSIYNELEQGSGKKVTSLKEYREQQKIQREKEIAEAQAEIEEAKTKFKMSEAEIKAIADFGEKLRYADLVKIHRFLRKFPNMPGISPQNLQQVSGTSPGYKTERERFLETL